MYCLFLGNRASISVLLNVLNKCSNIPKRSVPIHYDFGKTVHTKRKFASTRISVMAVNNLTAFRFVYQVAGGKYMPLLHFFQII